jgi:hypothetical protein
MRINALMIIMAAMGCGMIAAMGVSQMESLPHQQAAVVGAAEVQLFVAGVEVPAGELLTPQLVRLERWPRDRVPDGAVTRLQDLHHQVTRQPLLPGQPLRRNLLRDATDLSGTAEQVVRSEVPDAIPSREAATAFRIPTEGSTEGAERNPPASHGAPPTDARRAESASAQSYPISKPLVVRISMSVHPHEDEPGAARSPETPKAEVSERADSQEVLLVPMTESTDEK